MCRQYDGSGGQSRCLILQVREKDTVPDNERQVVCQVKKLACTKTMGFKRVILYNNNENNRG